MHTPFRVFKKYIYTSDELQTRLAGKPGQALFIAIKLPHLCDFNHTLAINIKRTYIAENT